MKFSRQKHLPIGFREVEALKEGDEILILIGDELCEATVIQPMFWNADADEPDWEVETTNGFVDVYSIYKATGGKHGKRL